MILLEMTFQTGSKKAMHRRWSYFKTRVGFTMALFNILAVGRSVD